MLRQEDFPEEYGPFCDIQNHNLVLQVMDYEDAYSEKEEQDRRNKLVGSLESLLGEEKQDRENISQDDATEAAKKIKEMLEKKDKAFQHTTEYYAAIEDGQIRREAYRGVKVVSTVPYGIDDEIAKNPFKFLNLPEDSTFGQVRAAWMTLSKMWYPDMIYPENRDQYDRIFDFNSSNDFPIDGTNLEEWIENLEKLERPEMLSPETIEAISPKERWKYKSSQERYRKKELEYESVKAEMRIRATEKMKTINKAYREAKKLFSDAEEDSFAGFSWEEDALRSLYLNIEFTYKYLTLEGEGEIRRDFGRFASTEDGPYLSFDYGDVYMAQPNSRQNLTLKSLFAWIELRQEKELSPLLLDDLKEHYKLNDDQSEQLRLMLMNHESFDFISETLEIPERESYRLRWFTDMTYDSPTYYHLIGPRGDAIYPMGVEITPEGGITLSFKSQIDQCFSRACKDTQAQFTPTDMKMMQAIAYGPLLQQMEKI